MLWGLSSRTKSLSFQPIQFWHLQAILLEQRFFSLKFLVKYCQNIRRNDGFSPIGLVMSIDGRNDNSRVVRAKNSLWDESNRGFLQLGIFLFRVSLRFSPKP